MLKIKTCKFLSYPPAQAHFGFAPPWSSNFCKGKGKQGKTTECRTVGKAELSLLCVVLSVYSVSLSAYPLALCMPNVSFLVPCSSHFIPPLSHGMPFGLQNCSPK